MKSGNLKYSIANYKNNHYFYEKKESLTDVLISHKDANKEKIRNFSTASMAFGSLAAVAMTFLKASIDNRIYNSSDYDVLSIGNGLILSAGIFAAISLIFFLFAKICINISKNRNVSKLTKRFVGLKEPISKFNIDDFKIQIIHFVDSSSYLFKVRELNSSWKLNCSSEDDKKIATEVFQLAHRLARVHILLILGILSFAIMVFIVIFFLLYYLGIIALICNLLSHML